MWGPLFLLIAWLVFVVLIFGLVFDYFQSTFFSFGPSPELIIIGINYTVDTWYSYYWISTFAFCQAFIITFAGDNIYPWINAVVLNRQIPTLNMSKLSAFAITNLMYNTFSILGLFVIGISMSQFDFWVYSTTGASLAGAIQSWRCIRDKLVT